VAIVFRKPVVAAHPVVLTSGEHSMPQLLQRGAKILLVWHVIVPG
jgi:hypothetical protein